MLIEEILGLVDVVDGFVIANADGDGNVGEELEDDG